MKFRKRPVIVEAVRWTGCNANEIHSFLNLNREKWGDPGFTLDGKRTTYETKMEKYTKRHGNKIAIQTLEGTVYVSVGDWVIRGIKGEYYPCKPDIFEQSYDQVT